MHYYWTDAPNAYDYGYTVETGQERRWNRDGRLVSIPAEHAEYQTDRYRSGLYLVEPA